MPYVWIDPEEVLTHVPSEGDRKVTIYHIYRRDYASEGTRKYWYGYTSECDDEGNDSFDIRSLPNFKESRDRRVHKEILIEAIDNGWLTPDGIDEEAIQEDREAGAI